MLQGHNWNVEQVSSTACRSALTGSKSRVFRAATAQPAARRSPSTCAHSSAQAVDNFFSGGGAAYSSEPQADASKIAELFERYRGACRLSTLGPISCFDVASSSTACRADPVAFPVRAFGVEQVICTPPTHTQKAAATA